MSTKYFLTGSRDIWPGITGYIKEDSENVKIGYKNESQLFMAREVEKSEYDLIMSNPFAKLSDKARAEQRESCDKDCEIKVKNILNSLLKDFTGPVSDFDKIGVVLSMPAWSQKHGFKLIQGVIDESKI